MKLLFFIALALICVIVSSEARDSGEDNKDDEELQQHINKDEKNQDPTRKKKYGLYRFGKLGRKYGSQYRNYRPYRYGGFGRRYGRYGYGRKYKLGYGRYGRKYGRKYYDEQQQDPTRKKKYGVYRFSKLGRKYGSRYRSYGRYGYGGLIRGYARYGYGSRYGSVYSRYGRRYGRGYYDEEKEDHTQKRRKYGLLRYRRYGLYGYRKFGRGYGRYGYGRGYRLGYGRYGRRYGRSYYDEES